MAAVKSRRLGRSLLLASSAVLVAVGVAAGVAFNSTFQTWLARRVLASHPEFRASVGFVSASLGRITLRDLQFEQAGARFTVPEVVLEFPLLAAACDHQLKLTRLAGRAWTIDLAHPAGDPPGRGRGPAATAAGAPPSSRIAPAFAGLLVPLTLPWEVSVDGVELDGVVMLPESRGQAKVSLSGGGFAAGRDGKLAIVMDAVLEDPRVSAVGVRANLAGRMDTPRTFARLELKFAATAQGTQFPAGVELAGEGSATRVATGEAYAASLVTQGRELLHLQAEYPRETGRFMGTWKVNMRDADVAPFALGLRLPRFQADGAGGFDADAGFAAVHASGRLAATASELQVVRPELAVLGEIKLEADFDLAERGGVLAVQRLAATLAAGEPVATFSALQPFEFSPATGELRTSDATRELVGVSLHGVPVAWVQPLVTGFELTGNRVRGDWVGMARGGGIGLRSTTPIAIGDLAVAQGGIPRLTGLDVSFGVSLDYNPSGWQAEIENLVVRRHGTTVLSLDAKVGRLAQVGDPLKTTGKFSANLPAVLTQPVASAWSGLTRGDAVAEFAASLGAVQAWQARIELRNLETGAAPKVIRLPELAADIRVDRATDGRMVFNAPLTITADTRKSDLALNGTFAPVAARFGTITATVSSHHLVVDDARSLAGMIAAADQGGAGGAVPSGPARAVGPPWAGLDGSVTLQLHEVVYTDAFRVSEVSGRIELEAGKVKLDGVRLGLGENGRAKLDGEVTYDAARALPYAMVGEVGMREFDPGPIFQALNRERPATLEGKFDVSSKLVSHAMTLEGLASGAGGEFHLTCKGGVFRGLPASVQYAAESTGRVAGLLAAAGNALGGLTGRKEYAAVSSRAQAITEFVSGLNPIHFDQLSVVVARDAALNATVKDFALIAPELRLTGNGTVLHRPGSSLLEDSLAMQFTLRARGRQGELLKYLGALDPAADDLGYAACTLPIRVGGTIRQPDPSDLNIRLAALALEKAGVTEKATELFNKLLGGGK